MRRPMRKIKNAKLARNMRRRMSIRKQVIGHADSPRISVKKSDKNLYVQAIDDTKGQTLLVLKTFGKNRVDVKANREGAKDVGSKLGQKLREMGLKRAVFDRGGLPYHGVLASLVEAIRAESINI